MPTLHTHSAPRTADVVVIGAGINGLAITREIAARGLDVVMIDQDDIAARTSAISTRLIHGGLKYLPRFEIPLVFESIRERDILLQSAPHLVRPYPMLIPFAKWNKTPGWLMSCGLIVHDVLALGKKLPLNRIVFSRRLRREWPSVAKAGVKWGGLFQDAHVPVTERFAVEIAIDASARGATILTHTPVTGLLRDARRVVGVTYRDRHTHETRELRAPVVINSAGPWVDAVLDLAGDHPRKIGPTKGSHLVVDVARQVVGAAADRDGEQVLVRTEVVAVRRLVRPLLGRLGLRELVDVRDPHVEAGVVGEPHESRLHLGLLRVGQDVGLVEDEARTQRRRRDGRGGQRPSEYPGDQHEQSHRRFRGTGLSHASPFGCRTRPLYKRPPTRG